MRGELQRTEGTRTVARLGTFRKNVGEQQNGAEKSQNIAGLLKETKLLVEYTSAVSASLDSEAVCLATARWFYDTFRYSLILFLPEPSTGGRAHGYTSLSLENCSDDLAVILKIFPELRRDDISDFRALGLHSPRKGSFWGARRLFELPGEMGRLVVFWGDGLCARASSQLLEKAVAGFTVALRNALEYEKVRELSMKDGLTGLYNRRVLEEMLEIEGRRREPSALSLLMIDLDDFKRVNDSFGHHAGDLILSTFGRFLRKNCREADLIARYGGEEFAVLMTGVSELVAHEVAERIRRKLAETVFVFEGDTIRLTASIGLSFGAPAGGKVDDLLRQADQAMYAAKNSGRNKVCVHNRRPLKVVKSLKALPLPQAECFIQLAAG